MPESVSHLSLAMNLQDILIDDQDQWLIEKYSWKFGSNGWYHSTKKCTVYLHRLILGIYGDQYYMVRFKDGNHNNCRRSNLEVLPMGQHARNIRRTKIKGCSYKLGRSSPWESRISHKGKNYYLGSFAEESDASEAYQKALRRIESGLPPK